MTNPYRALALLSNHIHHTQVSLANAKRRSKLSSEIDNLEEKLENYRYIYKIVDEYIRTEQFSSASKIDGIKILQQNLRSAKSTVTRLCHSKNCDMIKLAKARQRVKNYSNLLEMYQKFNGQLSLEDINETRNN